MRILIAEDDATSRNILTAVLKKHEYEVVTTSNGAEALHIMLQPDAPPLAILDWIMPQMDGIEVCRRIRDAQKNRSPYLIMLTRMDKSKNIIAGLEAGADDYVAKPFNAAELRARIEVGVRIINLEVRLVEQVQELEKALREIKTLRGIVPICASCKNIRDDKGYWNQVEVYVRDHTFAKFSHGLCPDCAKKLYPDFAKDYYKDPTVTPELQPSAAVSNVSVSPDPK